MIKESSEMCTREIKKTYTVWAYGGNRKISHMKEFCQSNRIILRRKPSNPNYPFQLSDYAKSRIEILSKTDAGPKWKSRGA